MKPTEKVREVMETMVTGAEGSLASAKRSGVDHLVRKADGELKVARAPRAQAEAVLTALAERGIDADEILCAIMEVASRIATEGALANAWSLLCAGQKAFAAALAEYDRSEES